MTTVVLVDAGGTNIGSVRYALQRLGVDAAMSDDAKRIRAAGHVILPGVGAAGPGMQRLRGRGLIEVIRGLKQPVLGVCLGMQLLFERSDEDASDCLGIIPGHVRRLADADGVRIPHMGWNRLHRNGDDMLLNDVGEGAWCYFVHSYAAPVTQHTVASSQYGAAFAAVVRRDNFYGTQFHPERSSATGARILENFLRL